ncbi:helix-turn-helix domain-containing protein, partial [Pseudomonas aeruginosa]|nr:helix-turn-helix domain-containing protein [Pseudomonas aeruginosa]
LAKTLLYAINGGVDEKLKIQVGPKTAPLRDEVLDYGTVMASLDHFMDWLAVQYITHEGQALETVAFSLGYQSLAAFSRAFKRITGQPPGALRATAR